MRTREKKASTRKVKNLKIKSLGADRAKQVKGGPTAVEIKRSSSFQKIV
jgi:hypothetical protein